MSEYTQTIPIALSRKAIEQIATELWLLDHPDFDRGAQMLPSAEIIKDYWPKVYAFDNALQMCRMAVVNLA